MESKNLEQVLVAEFWQGRPFTYFIEANLNRLIEAGWAWKRISMHGYWITGFTEMGHAAAEMCGLYADMRERWAIETEPEPDYEAYREQQEREHWANLEHAEDDAELQQWIDEYGFEPGGTCPDCGRTDAGCICNHDFA